ncbi:MAG: polysaccharide deacetylase family protein, partial [Pseudolabrys sp.]
MRTYSAFLLATVLSAVAGIAWAQNAQTTASTPVTPAAAPAAVAPTPAAPAASADKAKCDNPNALGVERVVQIDTTGGPGFGFENFKAYDFLRDHEVVLTFDDGPWPGNTERVLKA